MNNLHIGKGLPPCPEKTCAQPQGNCNPEPVEVEEAVCGIPDAPCPTNSHIEPPKCPPEKPCGPKYFCPAPEPECPADHSPCTAPEDIPCGCDWTQECEPSIPPAIPCPPMHTGWGEFDGGIMYWADIPECMERCTDLLSALCWLPQYDYKQWDWHHVLDLSTHNEINTNLAVRRNGLIKEIDVQEFINLSVRMARLAFMFEAVPEAVPPKPQDMGLMVVQTGEDDAGRPTYGLALSYAGVPTGTPIQLQTTWSNNGQATGLALPHAIIPPLP